VTSHTPQSATAKVAFSPRPVMRVSLRRTLTVDRPRQRTRSVRLWHINIIWIVRHKWCVNCAVKKVCKEWTATAIVKQTSFSHIIYTKNVSKKAIMKSSNAGFFESPPRSHTFDSGRQPPTCTEMSRHPNKTRLSAKVLLTLMRDLFAFAKCLA